MPVNLQESFEIMDTNGFVLILLALLVIMIVLLLFIGSRYKKQMASIEQINQQLTNLAAVPADEQTEASVEDASEVEQTAVDLIAAITEEKQDAREDVKEESEASAYNTGKSGKIYTKEELELLIKE
ncbi:MAG: hypothetical protein J6M22_06045 [Firmicutes bacterium]|nr:hypothetical protein [Bacillota bacterium]